MLATRIEFIPAQDAEIFAEIPAAPAVFLLRGEDANADPYISKTANLRRRLQRLLAPPAEQSRKLNLRNLVRTIEFTPTASDFESGFTLYQVLRAVFPKTYSARLRLRFAPLVKLHMENAYPRASITTRLGRTLADYYGPFASRTAAEKFVNDSLDFFQMRRCVEDLQPDPAFPGCIYSEMKMCLAPCFKGCSDEQYDGEVARVQAYFESAGDSLSREIAARRDGASAELNFEAAAEEHARLEKLKPVLAQLPEIVRRIDQLAGVIVQRSVAPQSVNFFQMEGGCVSEPVVFAIQATEHAKSQSMESRIGAALAAAPVRQKKSALEAMEHLSLLKRWYFRGSRTGEIFFTDKKGELPMRRLVRGISRVYRGETAGDAENTTATGPVAS